MKSKGDNWEDFLGRNHFKEVEQDESSSKIRRIHWKPPSNPKLQNKIRAKEIPKDEHIHKDFDDETPLANVLESIRKKKFVNTHEGLSKERTEQDKISKRKRTLTIEKPSRRSARLMKLIIKESLGFVDS